MSSKSPIINFIFLEPLWKKISASLTTDIHMALETTSSKLKKNFSNDEVSVVFSCDSELQSLNKTFRQKDKPTNVLSFPSDEPQELGDIILAYETVLRESQVLNISMIHHTIHLIIHGFLHLLGYDHEKESEAKVMEKLEVDILRQLNIDNPYEDE